MQLELVKSKILSLLAENKIEAEVALSILNDMPEEDRQANEPIAIVSMGLRLPNADTPEELWEHLTQQTDLVTPFPRERFDLVVKARDSLFQKYESKRKELENDPRSFGAWLSNIDRFDPETFGLSAHEAQFMGPTERLFLLASLEAILKAGYQPEELKGSKTGVFVAHSPHPAFEYLNLFDEQDERAFISNIPANLGYHLAYTLDLQGPVLTVNTSCSSSLAAVHTAKNALRQGDCDIALVGGANLILFPFWELDAPDHVVRSPHYRCAAYDADADGIIGGEGIAVVVLKRLSDAVRDGDHIHAVIKGSGMSSDGSSNGMHVPNPDAQARAILAALEDAGVSAETISYVEGHGAGTPVGDLIEVDGLTKSFRQYTDANGYCHLGSIKSVIGHLGDAAGIAGLIKTTLSMERKQIPGINHFQAENPKIGFGQTPFLVSGDNLPWEQKDGQPRRAGINSIGISGTNVHVVLEEYVPVAESEELTQPVPVYLTAPTRYALWELIQSLTKTLRAQPNLRLQDVAHTLNGRRRPAASRVGIFAATTAELLEKLERVLNVRTFERVPEIFFTQGIFLADEAETRVQSLAHFDRYTASVDPADLALMKRYLEGDDVAEEFATRFANGNLLPLPVVPFKTKSIWLVNATDLQRDVSDLFFGARWDLYGETPGERADAIEKGALWMVFAREEDRVLELVRDRLEARGAEAVLVWPGKEYAKLGEGSYRVAFDSIASFESLFADLGKDKLARLGGIVHGFTLKQADGTMDSLAGVEASQEEGVFSLFCLNKAILANGLNHPFQITAVSSMVEQVQEEDQVVPSRVTLFGLNKVISQESPTITTFTIDHDLNGEVETVAQQLTAEITVAAKERREMIAYRSGQRYTKYLDRQADEQLKEIPVRDGGTYVVAGGTGYLGMQVGRFLSERANVQVVLLARNPLPERSEWERILNEAAADDMLAYKLREIQAIEARGSKVEVVLCDVTDADSTAAVFAEIRQRYGAINGAFLLVKQLYHLWLHELKFEQFKKGIDNRVKGAWLVEREVRSEELDFFILFSSISSLMGTKSASECCAVNQYLDALSGHLNSRGVPTHVLNLTLILDDKSDFGAKTPIPPIDFVDFQSSLARFFRNGQPWSLVSRFDMEEVHFLKPVLKIPFGPAFWEEVEQFVERKSSPQASGSENGAAEQAELDGAEIRRRFENIWKLVLGIESVQGASNFFSSGGSSLSALRFVQQFRQNFADLTFEVADLYSMPTFDAQVAYVEKSLGGEQDLFEDLFDALESDDISMEDALALLKKSTR